jgi:hypothetical protein
MRIAPGNPLSSLLLLATARRNNATPIGVHERLSARSRTLSKI